MEEKKSFMTKLGGWIGSIITWLAGNFPFIGDMMAVIKDNDPGSPKGEMNWPKFGSILLRYAVLAIIGYYVIKGVVSADDASTLKDYITN